MCTGLRYPRHKRKSWPATFLLTRPGLLSLQPRSKSKSKLMSRLRLHTLCQADQTYSRRSVALRANARPPNAFSLQHAGRLGCLMMSGMLLGIGLALMGRVWTCIWKLSDGDTFVGRSLIHCLEPMSDIVRRLSLGELHSTCVDIESICWLSHEKQIALEFHAVRVCLDEAS